MKTFIKHNLSRLGLLPTLELIRRLPEIVRWVQSGCTGIAPPPVKRKVLSAYRKRYGFTQFIETGTHLGDTLAYVAQQKGVHATSIELDEAYYRAAKQRFLRYTNVTILQGDSGNCCLNMFVNCKNLRCSGSMATTAAVIQARVN